MLSVVLDVTGGQLGLDLFAARIPVHLDLLASLLCVCVGGGAAGAPMRLDLLDALLCVCGGGGGWGATAPSRYWHWLGAHC
jgi:hypothetical protein